MPTGSEPEILDQPPGDGQPATDGSTDGEGRESIDRNALTEAGRERLEAQIAEINERIAQAQEALERAEERRAGTVTVSPGEDGQLCGDAVFGMQAEDRTGQPCSVVVGPDAVGNELFGSGGSSTNPEG